jgi:enoyl-CoA hydratase
VTAVVDDPVAHALAIAEQLAGYPQETMLSDRRSMYDGYGHPLEEALKIEARYGAEVLLVGRAGAARFAAGEGRGAQGV